MLCDEHLSYGVKRTQAGLVVTEDDPEGRFKAGDRVTEAQRAAFNIPVASTQSPLPASDVVVCKTCKATTPADVWKLAAERAQSVVKLRAERDTAEQLLTAAVKDYEEAIAERDALRAVVTALTPLLESTVEWGPMMRPVREAWEALND